MKSIIFFLALFSLCIACGVGEYEIIIKKEYVMYAKEEQFQIWRGASETGVLVAAYNGTETDNNSVKTLTACTSSGMHTIVLMDTFGDGWGNVNYSPYILVELTGITLIKTTLPYASGSSTKRAEVTFMAQIDIPFGLTWKYTDIPQSANDWNTLSFDDSTWQTGTAGQMPDFTSSIRYYRLSSSITDLSLVNTMFFSFLTNHAFVIYVQGTEVTRTGLPTGPITSTTLPLTTPEAMAIYQSITIYKYLLPQSGNYMIALEIHLPQPSSMNTDFFNFGGGIMGPGNTNECTDTRLLNGVSTEVPESDYYFYPVGSAFDGKLNTYYRSVEGQTAVLTYMFPKQTSEHFNSYAIWSSPSSAYGHPKSWKFYGTSDGNNWSLLDFKENIDFGGQGKRLQFSLNGVTQTFKGIKIEILSSSTGTSITLCNVAALICNYPRFVAGINYEPNVASGFAGIDTIYLAPATSGYGSYTITPALPQGVTLSATGILSGSPATVINQQYTVSATSFSDGQTYTTTITINYQGCNAPENIQLRMRKINKSYSYEDRFEIQSSNGTVLFTSPTFTDNVDWTSALCLPSQVLTLVTSDTKSDGWAYNAVLYIDFYDYNGNYYTVGKYGNERNTPSSFLINGIYTLSPQSSQWKYTQGTVPTNWYSTTEPSGFSVFPMASLPTPTSPLWLFRHTFTITSKDGFIGFDTRVLVRAGFVIYINGNEIFRRNLPEGDITSTTTPLAGDQTTSAFVVTSTLDNLIIGTNTIAIAIVNMASNIPEKIYFDSSIVLITPSPLGRNWDITVTDEPSTGFAHYLLDENYYNTWTNKPKDTRVVSVFVDYGTHRAEFINKYCFVSAMANVGGMDPSDWAVYGSNDQGVTRALLGNVTNAYFSGRNVQRCFYLPKNIKSYSMYIFYMTEPADASAPVIGYTLAEMLITSEDLSQLVIPPLNYIITSIQSYVGVPFTEMTPNSDLYGNYRITPALELPLELDTSTGSIRGIPNLLMAAAPYTITATDPLGRDSSTTLTISTVYCTSPNIMFIVAIHSTTYARETGFELKNTEGTVIGKQSSFSDNQVSYFPFCQPIGIYDLTLTDSANDGWDGGYAQVLLEDDTVMLTCSLGEKESQNTFRLSAGYVIPPLRAEWKYYNSGTSPANGWNTVSFVDTNWKISTSGNYEAASGMTQYFRKMFTIDDITPYASAVFNLRTKYGIIVYLNGEEVYRNNLPIGIVSYSTSCTAVSSSIQLVGSSVSISFGPLVQSQNVLAIEVHRHTVSPDTIIDFDGSLLLVADKSWRVLDGIPSADLGTEEDAHKAFDNTSGSAYTTGPRCEGATLTWTYNNNRKEYVSSYTIVTGPKCNARHPSAWEIQGSNDGINWSTLDIRTKQYWSIYSQKREFDFYNNRSFNAYRFITTECDNNAIDGTYMPTEENCDIFNGKQGFQVGEIGFYVKKIEGACNPTEDGYSGALEGSYAFKDCNEFYSGRIQRLCTSGQLAEPIEYCSLMAPTKIEYTPKLASIYKGDLFEMIPKVYAAEFSCTITPSLPNGVSMDTLTGKISGKTTEIFESKTFTVTCTNSIGSIDTEIFIVSNEKPGLPIWAWIVIVVLAVLLIAIVLFCILCRLKSKKNKGHSKLGNKNNLKNKSNTTTTIANKDVSGKTVKI